MIQYHEKPGFAELHNYLHILFVMDLLADLVFEVAMDCYDGEEVCELVGSFV